ncbi:MAG: ABC transporter ATP-binding protein [Coriobacteriales bacterium]|jgi:iron complex transport system ATP-binding protein|nr:ABC transporter ATP-binding protein [Coriobacteriales bacterium]
MALAVEELSCGYQGRPVVSKVSFSLSAGEVLAVLGPNGVGKTTLFKTVLGFLKPLAGRVMLEGRDLSELSRRELARLIAYVPQTQSTSFAFPVEEYVLMGRAPHLGMLKQPTATDRQIVRDTMLLLGIQGLADKTCTSISGGELQLVAVARALAQQPRYLIMDEPTANLDYGNQARILEQIIELANKGLGVMLTTHNPEQAFTLESRVVLLRRDAPYLEGDFRAILTEAHLNQTYDIDVVLRSFEYQQREYTVCRTIPKCRCGEHCDGA